MNLVLVLNLLDVYALDGDIYACVNLTCSIYILLDMYSCFKLDGDVYACVILMNLYIVGYFGFNCRAVKESN